MYWGFSFSTTTVMVSPLFTAPAGTDSAAYFEGSVKSPPLLLTRISVHSCGLVQRAPRSIRNLMGTTQSSSHPTSWPPAVILSALSSLLLGTISRNPKSALPALTRILYGRPKTRL